MAFADKTLVLLAGLTVGAPVWAGNFYCCPDPASGRRVCADTLPEQCKGRAYRIIDGAGNLIREVGAPLTPEQKALQEQEAVRKKEQDALQRERRRKDMALLEIYGSVQDIDKARARAEEEINYALRQAEARIADAQTRRARLEQEAEFYKNKSLPPELAKGLKDTEAEINAQKGLQASKQQDLESVRAKYADDKKRYMEITTGGGNVMHPAMSGPRPPPGK